MAVPSSCTIRESVADLNGIRRRVKGDGLMPSSPEVLDGKILLLHA